MESFKGFTLLDPALEERRRAWASKGLGTLLQACALGILCAITLFFPQRLDSYLKEEVLLIPLPKFSEPRHVSNPPRPEMRQEAVIPQPTINPPRLEAPARPQPLKPPEAPKLEARVPELSLPRVSAPPLPPRPLPPVKTNVFGGSSEVATLRLPAHDVQTGGFGSTNGMKGASRDNGNTITVGSFGLPDGPGRGNGTGGTRGVPGTVASSGFGDGIAHGTPHGARGAVSASGFGEGVATGNGTAAPERSVKSSSGFNLVPVTDTHVQKGPAAPASAEPMVILFKPNPVYTEEARRLRIEGEVTLSVVFEAGGRVRVLGVERGLGHGLDESAMQAAERIKFKPAMQGGQAVDFPATVRIVFELAS
jgi:TonB family protein